jgi:signal transduction histidine kinase
MKFKKPVFKLILICLVFLYAGQVSAQQSRVDSVIQLLNRSILDEDSIYFIEAINLLNQTDSLTSRQVDQLETAAQQFEKWGAEGWPFSIQHSIFLKLINNDSDLAISYGKNLIEKLDPYSTPETRRLKANIITVLRPSFRNSERLEEGLRYYSQKLNEYIAQNDSVLITQCYYALAGFYKMSGLTDLAIYNIKKSISYIDTLHYKFRWTNHTGVLGSYYLSKSDKREGLKFLKMALRENLKSRYVNAIINAGDLATMMLQANQLDSAAYFLSIAKPDPSIKSPFTFVNYLQLEAWYFIQTGNLEQAEKNLTECWRLIQTHSIPVSSPAGIMAPDYYLALIRSKQNRLDEAIALLIRDIERLDNNREEILRDNKLLGALYAKNGQNDLAAKTYAQFIAMQDSLWADQDNFRTISFEAEQQINQNKLSIDQLESQNKVSSLYRNFSISLAALLFILSGSIYYRFHSKKKANEVLNKTLTNLKATQAQLVQSEKMASLGELTTGIAHEIQNPLNFVNNFSEVNQELIRDLKSEIQKGNIEEVNSLANDIESNEEKINHHGKRADGIVKSMLQHSRTSSGQKELTDINALCEEYLRLSYHGYRAKDKSFNAKFEFHPDPNLPKVNVVPQDIGRVVLNLINNAFYPVSEKQKAEGAKPGSSFEPTVIVSTHFSLSPGEESLSRTMREGEAIITVKDNGPGIPDSIKEKIFQPFFTTKPTGQGTGLGLSLSYDIVKAHGGEFMVNSKENEGTEFIVKL